MAFGFGLGVQRLGSFGVATLSDLSAINPGSTRPTAFVYADGTTANNGVYTWSGSAWVRQRGLPDGMGRFTSVSGTNTITATLASGVDPAEIKAAILVPAANNSGAVTLNGEAIKDRAGSALSSGALVNGVAALLMRDGSQWRLMTGAVAIIADVSGLQAALDAKAAASHTHAQSDVTGLVSALAGKAASSHTHAISDITSLQASLDAKAPLANPTFTGSVTLPGNPASALQAATKQYVDNLAAGLDPKASVRVATAGALATNTRSGNVLTASANGALSIDGVSVSVADRVLVKNEATAANNGIYTVTAAGAVGSAWVLTRATDMDAWSEVPGSYVWTEEGSTLSDTAWVATANSGGTLNTTAITWSQFAGTGAYQAANADLAAIAALSPNNDDVLQRKAGAWTNRTPAQVKTDLALAKGDVGLGNVDNTSDATKNAATATLTNKRVTPRIASEASNSAPTPNADTTDQHNVTALAAAATWGAPTGTPTDGQKLLLRIKDNGTARALSWNAAYRSVGGTLPTTTVINKTLYVGLIYNAADSKWDCVAVSQE